jgi:hypothetical protein
MPAIASELVCGVSTDDGGCQFPIKVMGGIQLGGDMNRNQDK